MQRIHVLLAIAAVAGTTTVLARQSTQPDKVQAQPVGVADAMRGPMVPIGAKWDLRLQSPLDSATARVDQRFEAFTLLDYSVEGRTLIPAMTLVRGFVGSVLAAGPTNRGGSLTLAFDDLKMGERSIRLRASVEQLFKGQPSSDTTARVGTDASIGAAIGRLPGGGQGLMVGLIVGPGGSIASTEAADVKLPLGTIMRIRIDRAIELGGSGSGVGAR